MICLGGKQLMCTYDFTSKEKDVFKKEICKGGSRKHNLLHFYVAAFDSPSPIWDKACRASSDEYYCTSKFIIKRAGGLQEAFASGPGRHRGDTFIFWDDDSTPGTVTGLTQHSCKKHFKKCLCVIETWILCTKRQAQKSAIKFHVVIR